LQRYRGIGLNSHGSTARFALRTSAIAVALALLLPGCSEVGFPAVHDMPVARPDTPLTPDQVKRATDDLISERDRLQSIPPGTPPAADATGSTTPTPQNASLQTTGSLPANAAVTPTAGGAPKP
jgi:hypothetical protein